MSHEASKLNVSGITNQDSFVGTDLIFSTLSMLVLKIGSQNHKIQHWEGERRTVNGNIECRMSCPSLTGLGLYI